MQMTIQAEPQAVSEGLKALMASAMLQSLPDDGRDTAQIVLAEVLNNIVEHAYSQYTGEILIKLAKRPGALVCEIADRGVCMPDERLPEGKLKPLVPGQELPEGGFGWFLIRSLSQDLCYRRADGENLLSFRLNTEQSAA